MRSYVIDCESVPASPEVLEARMPEELRNPEMPDSIANPPEVDLSGCPAYASIKDEAARDDKRAQWKADKLEKAHRSAQEARQKWELGIVEARTKFTQNAALDARLGHAKLIGMKDAETGNADVYVWEENPAQVSRIKAWLKTLPYISNQPSAGPIRKEVKGMALAVYTFPTEAEMLTSFFADFKDAMHDADTPFVRSQEKPNQCVTYCGNSFDFPFLYRRSWLTGAPQVPLYRRGRYWDESRMVDLRDLWTFGSREDKDRSGGLDNLAAALGYERPKLHGGADFHRFYAEDPVEGIMYNLADLAQTEWVGRKMGVVR